MGKHYAQQLRDLVDRMGGSGLRVYVNEDGLHPQYHEHVIELLLAEGCQIVDSRDSATVVVEGYTRPDAVVPGQVCVILEDGRLVALGEVSRGLRTELEVTRVQ